MQVVLVQIHFKAFLYVKAFLERCMDKEQDVQLWWECHWCLFIAEANLEVLALKRIACKCNMFSANLNLTNQNWVSVLDYTL